MFLLSCQPQIDKENIYGTWTTVHEAPQALSDSVQFIQPDSLKITFVFNGAIRNRIAGSFTLDSGVLTTRFDSTVEKFDVHELTDEYLTAKKRGGTTILKMRKLQQVSGE